MTDEFDDVLAQLESLHFMPERSAAAARSGLQDFLDEAARLRPAAGDRPTVSARLSRRLTGWKINFTQERSPMFALAIKLVLVLAVMFGGAGISAAAAQSSLPNDALYPVKLLIEGAELSLTSGPEAQIDVQLNHAQQRVREMVQLTDRGAAIPAEVPQRLQTQLQAALQIAAQLNDPAMQIALDHIQQRTQDQFQEMERLQLHDSAQAVAQARELAQLGQTDPQAFRSRWGYGRPADAPPQPQLTPPADPSQTPQPSRTPQATHTLQPTCTPQRQHTGTPQGQSFGPGPQSTKQPATPIGEGAGHEYGPGAQPTTVPGSDSGNGETPPQATPQGSGAPQNMPPSGGSGHGSDPQPAATPRGSGGSH